MAEAAALPRIQQFLANQRGADAVGKAIKELRTNITVTYMGDFAPGDAGKPANAQPTGAISTEAAAPAAPAQETATAAPPVTPATVDQSFDEKTRAAIEKGVKALK